MKKLLLVDGSNLLFQMFYGMPARILNRKGKAIHGTLGFVGALLKMIRMIHPTHIAVLFDGENENERSILLPDYKANRIDYSDVSVEENPFSQLNDIYEALDYLNIKHAETVVCEADDWIAGYALSYGKEIDIVISSFDSDYFQLLNEHVSILRYRGTKSTICTPNYLLEHFGIMPNQYASFKSLVGDSSDNIKGVSHIGPKTAAYLLNKYQTLDGILEQAFQIERPSLRDSILREAERLRVNYRLIKLSGQVELPFSLNELIYVDTGLKTNDVLNEIGLLP